VASEQVSKEETLPVAASDAVTPERPDLLAYQTSQADSITEPLLAETDLPDLRLNAIAWDENPGRSIAVLNEKILHEGEFLGDVRVLRINPDHVVLICGKEHVIKRIHPPIPGMSPEATVEHASDETYEAEASDPTEESSEETAYFLADFRPIINFDYKTSELTLEAYEELDSIATILERSDKCEIVLRGYTDDVGPKGYNSRLSESRANIVRSYLVGKGISPERITIIGMGEKNPLRPNTTDEGRAANRRVEIEFVPDSDY
jgi:outer membrane protein OmpA-like peptidoglycan-associated protein